MNDKQRLRGRHARLDRAAEGPAGQGRRRPRSLGQPALRLRQGRRTGHGQPQPVARAEAQHRGGPVQGGRRHLPDPRLRHGQHDAGRRRHRLDRDRHAAHRGDRPRRDEAGHGNVEQHQAGGRGDLHAQPCRSLRRRARRGRRGRRALGQGQGHRARRLHGQRGGRERARRQRHVAPRQLHVWRLAAGQRQGLGGHRPRHGAEHRRARAGAADR